MLKNYSGFNLAENAMQRQIVLKRAFYSCRGGCLLDKIRILKIGGVYWTKFECISDKIRRILTNDTCASHWPLAFIRDACSVLLCVRSVASAVFVITLKKRIVPN